MYFWNCFRSAKNKRVRKTQKIYGPQIADPLITTFAEGPEI
jgi:hypothetical protein